MLPISLVESSVTAKPIYILLVSSLFFLEVILALAILLRRVGVIVCWVSSLNGIVAAHKLPWSLRVWAALWEGVLVHLMDDIHSLCLSELVLILVILYCPVTLILHVLSETVAFISLYMFYPSVRSLLLTFHLWIWVLDSLMVVAIIVFLLLFSILLKVKYLNHAIWSIRVHSLRTNWGLRHSLCSHTHWRSFLTTAVNRLLIFAYRAARLASDHASISWLVIGLNQQLILRRSAFNPHELFIWVPPLRVLYRVVLLMIVVLTVFVSLVRYQPWLRTVIQVLLHVPLIHVKWVLHHLVIFLRSSLERPLLVLSKWMLLYRRVF